MKYIIRFCFVFGLLLANQSFAQTFNGVGGPLTPTLTTSGVVTYDFVVSGVDGAVSDGIYVPAILGYNTQINLIQLNNVQHTFAADLDLRLVSPSGAIYTFNLDNGGSTGLDIATDMIFTASASDCADSWTSSASAAQPENGLQFETIESSCGPIASTTNFLCSANVYGIEGDLVNGTWMLQITDDAGGDTGTFDDFTVGFSSIAPPTTDSNGNTFDLSACPGFIDNFPYSQDFELMQNCSNAPGQACELSPTDGWYNDTTNDDIDWTVDTGGTTSGSTGPNVDHTLGNTAGKYLYTEATASGTGYPNKVAIVESPPFNLSGLSSVTLSFWYHMYGASMGTMHIDVDPMGDGNWVNDVIPSWTANQNSWQEQTVNLNEWAGNSRFKFRIRGITGNSFTSDMAIDDILIEGADELCTTIIAKNNNVAVICL